ncbi:MAG: sulfur carrier protein ThiS [Gammaproteobacteria bacterium]
MMTIVLNGKNKQIDDHSSIEQLLKSLDLEDKRLAVEINQAIIPRSNFNSHTLNESDKVEIVQAIGGGDGSSSGG